MLPITLNRVLMSTMQNKTIIRVKMNNHLKKSLILVVFLVVTACAPSGTINEPNDLPNTLLTTTSDIKNTADKMLFTIEDLTDIWLEDTYAKYNNKPDEETTLLDNQDSIPEYHVGAFIAAFPPERDKYGNVMQSMHATTQDIYAFRSADVAHKVFIEDQDFWNDVNRYAILRMTDISLLTDSAYTGCAPWYDNVVHTCRAVFRHDRYVVLVDTFVDGELITLEEWKTFVKAVDAKIVAQAGK